MSVCLCAVFSYSYSGLMMEGLGKYLPERVFPVTIIDDVWGHGVAKTVWEVAFGMISMFGAHTDSKHQNFATEMVFCVCG